MGKTDIENILDFTASKLNSLEFDDYAISATRGNRSQLRFADSQITIAKNWASLELGVFAAKNSKTVAVEIEDLSEDSIITALESLEKLANSLPPNQNYFGISSGPFSYPTIEHLADTEFVEFHDQSSSRCDKCS